MLESHMHYDHHINYGNCKINNGKQLTAYEHFALVNMAYVNQSSSRSLEKFGEDILTSPEVIRAQMLHFKPNFKFSRLFFFGGGASQLWCALARFDLSLARVKILGGIAAEGRDVVSAEKSTWVAQC